MTDASRPPLQAAQIEMEHTHTHIHTDTHTHNHVSASVSALLISHTLFTSKKQLLPSSSGCFLDFTSSDFPFFDINSFRLSVPKQIFTHNHEVILLVLGIYVFSTSASFSFCAFIKRPARIVTFKLKNI